MTVYDKIALAEAPRLVVEAARRRPDAIAIEGDEPLDYRSLVARATALAGALRAAGVREGELVAVCLPRSVGQIVATLAAWFAGAGYLPLDPALPEARLAALVADARCAAIVADPALAARVADAEPVVGPDARAEGTGIVPTDPDGLAYAIYTSGSTGAPKAVEVSHANLAALVAWHADAFAVAAGTRTSHLAGLGFDAAAWEVWPTLAAGGTLALVDEATRLDPAALRDWLVERRIEVAFAPTALAEPLLALEWPAAAALRVLLTGAEALKARPRPGLPFRLVNNYGPTEATVVATSGTVAPDGASLPAIGRPIAGTRIHLLDDAGREAPAGEIFVGGAQVARGYRGDPALTAERFVNHPQFGRLYRTGDLAAWGPDGELAFRGRIDAQLKVRGHRVEPAEIAAALNALPGVAASAVALREGELVAYVVERPQAAPTALALRSALAEVLPDYMIPARFARIAALPLTANGKVDLAALPDPAADTLPEGTVAAAATTPTEQRLLAIVAELIGRDDIGVDDDFFLLGGHSLLGTQLVMRAREAFGVELTLFHLFEARTVARLAGIVEGLVSDWLDAMSDEDVRRLAAG